jgi:hypothetical protein
MSCTVSGWRWQIAMDSRDDDFVELSEVANIRSVAKHPVFNVQESGRCTSGKTVS